MTWFRSRWIGCAALVLVSVTRPSLAQTDAASIGKQGDVAVSAERLVGLVFAKAEQEVPGGGQRASKLVWSGSRLGGGWSLVNTLRFAADRRGCVCVRLRQLGLQHGICVSLFRPDGTLGAPLSEANGLHLLWIQAHACRASRRFAVPGAAPYRSRALACPMHSSSGCELLPS